MQINRQKLMYDVEDILYQAHYMHGRRKVAKEIVNHIMDFVDSKNGGGIMNIDLRTEFLARGGDEASIKMFDRVCKVMSFDMMPLTESACEVYKWIADREAKGEKLETFAAWARGAERAQYIAKYRKDAGNIRNDWALAFPVKKETGVTRQVDRL